jgi:hypothetical protein
MYPHRCIFADAFYRFSGQRESILRIISAAKSMLSRNAISRAGGSAVTRAWPQVGFSCAICTMSLRMFSGSRGRPACDFHFQDNLKPLRCQLISVSSLTMTKASFRARHWPAVGSRSMASRLNRDR